MIAHNLQLHIMLLYVFSISRIILITMSKQLVAKNSNKITPSMHKSIHNLCSVSSCGKHGFLRNKNCTCLDSTHEKSNSNTIMGDNGTIVC